jgi:hypothetical protein
MPNTNYPQLTQEQKRRKQAIRNWKNAQKQLVESYDFAKECARIPHLPKDYQYTNICKTLVDLFHTDDKYWNDLDATKILAEKTAEFCLC